MQIHRETLKTLRDSKGFTQEKLSDKSGITKRTISRIEVGKGGKTRAHTVKQIAKTLGVLPEALCKAPDAEAKEEEEFRRLFASNVYNLKKHHLDGETLIAYDLVDKHYGVSMRQLVNVAPLLFTLLAEMSLADRRRRAKETKAALEAHQPTLTDFFANRDGPPDDFLAVPKFKGFDSGMFEFFSGLGSEERVSRSSLFRYLWDSDFGYHVDNAFTDFLKQLARELGDDNEALDPEQVAFKPDISFAVSIFSEYLKNLTGGSRRADFALSRGHVRIQQIPDELMEEGEDAASRRKKWLEEKVPDEEWEKYENWHDNLLKSTQTNEGGAEDA